MKTLTAEQLTQELEVDNIFDYMVESYDNGQFRQLREPFRKYSGSYGTLRHTQTIINT